jgi:hypothetical protein
MVESRIELPGAPADLLRLVEAADAMLREHGSKLKGQTVKAVWRVDGSFPPTERIALDLVLNRVVTTFVVWRAQLADPKKMRAAIRDHMWMVVTTFALNNQDEILKLVAELKPPLEIAER